MHLISFVQFVSLILLYTSYSKEVICKWHLLEDLLYKHPVSGLLELSTKRKWEPPKCVQIFDCGLAHKKQYIFKVVVNGQDFQSIVARDNKKQAKADAATAALQQLGLLPIDPNNPL